MSVGLLFIFMGTRSLTLRMAEKWSRLHGWNVKECVDKYLENARKWPFFGCKLFRAEVSVCYCIVSTVLNFMMCL